MAIARALVNRRKIVPAHELIGNLDTSRSQEIGVLLKGLNQKEGLTIILVTHNPALAEMADKDYRAAGRKDLRPFRSVLVTEVKP